MDSTLIMVALGHQPISQLHRHLMFTWLISVFWVVRYLGLLLLRWLLNMDFHFPYILLFSYGWNSKMASVKILMVMIHRYLTQFTFQDWMDSLSFEHYSFHLMNNLEVRMDSQQTYHFSFIWHSYHLNQSNHELFDTHWFHPEQPVLNQSQSEFDQGSSSRLTSHFFWLYLMDCAGNLQLAACCYHMMNWV